MNGGADILMTEPVDIALRTPLPPPDLQEATQHSIVTWQDDLASLFRHKKDRFPDVVWNLRRDSDDGDDPHRPADEIYGHKAIVYGRAPLSFRNLYFSVRPPTALDSFTKPPPLLHLTGPTNPIAFSDELEYLYSGKRAGNAIAQSCLDDTDKLRKDLVFMWRSRLYSDVRISLSFSEFQTVFSSHRFILVSRSSYFRTQLVRTDGEPPTLIQLPSPPFTPASLHFTLGFLYTGTLAFSHRLYDLSTAFAILRAALYLEVQTLHDEIQAQIIQEMLHGLFHASTTFEEYQRLTAGRWGTSGCRCSKCATRVPRVLEFSLAEDVRNIILERGARRAIVGLFGKGWCNTDFASLPQKIRDSALKGLRKRMTVQNYFALLVAAEQALSKLGDRSELWADTVRDMVLTTRKAIDEVMAKDAEACFNTQPWLEIMANDGVRPGFEDDVEWVMASVLRGATESFAPSLYQTLVSAILCRPHPTQVGAPYLSATSHIRVQVEQTRLDLLKWIGRQWLAIGQENGFSLIDGWALKEISDDIEIPVEDLLNPPTLSDACSSQSIESGLLVIPASNHPDTSKTSDADSEAAASSMRASVLSRSLALRDQPSSASKRSSTISPSQRFTKEVKANIKANERSDGRLSSSMKPNSHDKGRSLEDAQDSHRHQTPVKKVIITRASLANVTTVRKSTGGATVISRPTNWPSSPNLRGDARSSRPIPVTSRQPSSRAASRPISTTSVSASMQSGSSSRPPISRGASTETVATFYTASEGSSPTFSDPIETIPPSAASDDVAMDDQLSITSPLPVERRTRKDSDVSFTSTASSIRDSRSALGPSANPGEPSSASAAESMSPRFWLAPVEIPSSPDLRQFISSYFDGALINEQS